MIRVKWYWFVLVAAFFSTVFAYADEKDTGTYSPGEVVITGHLPETGTTFEVTAHDIQKKTVISLDQALELLPGVDVSAGGAGTEQINIRGSRSRPTLLLLNAIPINATYAGLWIKF
ncbi:MAG: Plug domain-containing protein [Desulfobacteraceae bacterium]|nr:Plug domain-containing protein [Desulfobacteraceae bacterium]